jgi:HEAT repeat protein
VAVNPTAAPTDPFWQVRLKSIRSLGKMKIDRAVHLIGGCITHEQANLRKEAAAALGEIAAPESVVPRTGGQRS